ncbi:hypothetical protein [Roseomonas xinghualingensis]|uniref:hypothetical protein n=1 Tax=Roseomonas xinghualingensis TaxID=2986475 RepID=UPI0021F0E083|nr:hypothetical protein [Roseomonas sp. SXEYE001]
MGAVAVAVGIYILLAGVIGWNPFSNGRPMIAGTTLMAAVLAIGAVLLLLGALLGQAGVKAQWRREMRETVAP